MFDKLFSRLKPAVFKYNDIYDLGDKKSIGVMAQDIVEGFNDEGLNIEEYSIIQKDGNGYMRVDYTQLIPILISRIKSLEEKVEVLQNDNRR